MKTVRAASSISFILLFAVIACSFGNASSPRLEWVEMPDGVRLATHVYLPEGDGPWPVLLGRTPYNKAHYASMGASMAEAGVAVVAQDVRGRFESEGFARPFADDGWGDNRDGLHTVEWILEQPWSNGRIATEGGSAGGITQTLLAAAGAPGIVGQHIEVAPLSNYHGVFYQGGVLRKALVEGWLRAAEWNYDENLAEIRAHPYYDDYWRAQSLDERVENVDWPVILVTGWYDIFLQGTVDYYEAIRQRGGPNGREGVRMIIGPYHHGIGMLEVGEFVHPESARIPRDLWPHKNEWLRHWLLDASLDKTPPRVLYYVMGAMPPGDSPGNEWRVAEEWPPPATPVSLYLSPDGVLSETPARSGRMEIAHDPDNPVPTIGGQNLLIPAGPMDQRSIEDREDVLLFTTAPLSAPMEITGRMTVVLRASTSAEDADFTAKLTDVYPDGRSMLIADGIQRLSLRDDLSAPSETVPNVEYDIEIDLGSTGIVIDAGHRLRLAIAASNSPRFEPYPQPTAQQVIIGGDRGARLVLPIVETP